MVYGLRRIISYVSPNHRLRSGTNTYTEVRTETLLGLVASLACPHRANPLEPRNGRELVLRREEAALGGH